MTPESVQNAGRRGFDLMVIPYAVPFEKSREMIKMYRDALDEGGHSQDDHNVMAPMHCYIHEDLETAKATVRDPIVRYVGYVRDAVAGDVGDAERVLGRLVVGGRRRHRALVELAVVIDVERRDVDATEADRGAADVGVDRGCDARLGRPVSSRLHYAWNRLILSVVRDKAMLVSLDCQTIRARPRPSGSILVGFLKKSRNHAKKNFRSVKVFYGLVLS